MFVSGYFIDIDKLSKRWGSKFGELLDKYELNENQTEEVLNEKFGEIVDKSIEILEILIDDALEEQED